MASNLGTSRATRRRLAGSVAVAALAALLSATPARALSAEKGKLFVSWDTTFSYGANWRVEERDEEIVGLANGGNAFSVNADDGNLNFAKGTLSSSVLKLTTELDANYADRFGVFVRAFAFTDMVIEDSDLERTPLSEEARDRVGTRAEFRDTFAWAKFDLGRVPVEIRAGEQVINWGESTFIQGGINAINPVDVSALRVPGAELREALLPVGAVLVSVRPHPNFGISGYWQYDWEETFIDPPGSYFSTTDIAGAGATRVMLGFGAVPDTVPIGFVPNPPVGVVVPRGDDVRADKDGQWGAAIRWFVPALGGTEFGAFYLQYDSRLPVISARTGTIAGVGGGNYAASARYYLEYPEDIALYGLSWNAQLGRSGLAFQGEVSQRKDVPLQGDDVELLYAALTPISPTLPNQYGAFGFNQVIPGYIRLDTTQFQMTLTKIFPQVLWADSFTLVWEGAAQKVHDLPEKETFRLEGPGTFTSGNPIHQLAGLQPGTEPLEAFPDDFSWGYVLAGRFEYNQAIGSMNLIPRFSFSHDVSGVSPGPGGNFIEDRMGLTVGLGATYLINWEFDLSYTTFMGAGRYNLLNDRDFVAAVAKYSF
jgi:hypothetical protein